MALRRLRFSNWNFLRMGLKFAPYAWAAWVSPWKSSDNLDAGGNLFPLFLWFSDWHWAVALNIMWFFFTLGYALHSENSRSRRNSTKCPEAFPGSQFSFHSRCFWSFPHERLFLFLSCLQGSFQGCQGAGTSQWNPGQWEDTGACVPSTLLMASQDHWIEKFFYFSWVGHTWWL